MTIITRETIYKRTKSGKVQIWYGELNGLGAYRTVSGQQDGKKTVSEWTQCVGKNAGKVNATTPVEQAALELEAIYNKRLEREYRRDINKIDVLLYTKPAKGLKWYEDAKKRPPVGTRVAIQPKLDGKRSITGADLQLKSQDGIATLGAPHLVEALRESGLFEAYPALQLDGELYNHDYKEDFEGLIGAIQGEPKNDEEREFARKVVQYHLYDLVLPVPKEARLDFLGEIYEEYLAQFGNMFQLTPTVIVTLDEGYQIVEHYNNINLENGYEGSFIHLLNEKGYEPGSRDNGFKVKKFQDAEFRIKKVLEGKGNWAGHAKAIEVYLPNGKTCKASVKGDKGYAKALLENKAQYEDKAWATVSFLRWTKDGKLNLPIFKAIRTDI